MNFFNFTPPWRGQSQQRKILMVTAVTIVVLFALALPAILIDREAMALDTGLDATRQAAQLPDETSLAKVIGQIIYAILGFLGIVFILLLIYGGFLRMTAQGDPGKIKTSYGIITSAVVGVIIILASYTITAFVLTKINDGVGSGGGGDGGGGFTQTGSCVIDPNDLLQSKTCLDNMTTDECSRECSNNSSTCSWNQKTCSSYNW